MKLIPKAKPVRIRILTGGEEHSSIETLRNNYSIGDVLPLVKDGRLYEWLLRIGELKAAECAYILIGSNLEVNSRDMVGLTASIFGISANSMGDLLKLWQKKYPKTLINHIKTHADTFLDVPSLYEVYHSVGKCNAEITDEEWRNIFVNTLKRVSSTSMIEYFKEFESAKPMNKEAWLTVMQYHAQIASDKDLDIIAQVAIGYPYLKNQVEEWYKKSTRSDIKVKEWVNVNLHKLDQNEQKLFDAFERNPSKFSTYSKYQGSKYQGDLSNFLRMLSSLYDSMTQQPIIEDILETGKFAPYIYILKDLYHMVELRNEQEALLRLKDFRIQYKGEKGLLNIETLDSIIEAIKKDQPIFGVKLSELTYRESVLFVAGLAKSDLENEK